MKKIIFGVLLMIVSLDARLWDSVCTSKQIQRIDDSRYIPFGQSNEGTVMFDKKTISIDKKNKIIRVWIRTIATPYGRKSHIQSFGQYADFSQYGYEQFLWRIDYKNRLYGLAGGTSYDCDRNPIQGDDPIDDKNVDRINIAPQTQPELIMETIMKIYNLK